MITNFKIFEESEKWNKETGYYVIMTEPGDRSVDIRLRKWLENNIGQITKMYYPGAWFDVKYDNMPEVIKSRIKGKTNFNSANILHISKNREDLEAIIAGNKYNI